MIDLARFRSSDRLEILTANRRDFENVPGLHFENWLD
jgi:predicted nucleic acid-binding protein